MATATASSFSSPAKYVHQGVIRLYGKYATTIGIGDVVKCFKLANGAVVLDAGLKGGGAGTNNVVLRIRDFSDSGSTTVSAGADLITSSVSGVQKLELNNAGQLHFEVSLSDGAAGKQGYVEVEMVCASAIATGTNVYWVDATFDRTGRG